jgi:hypothetical protein
VEVLKISVKANGRNRAAIFGTWNARQAIETFERSPRRPFVAHARARVASRLSENKEMTPDQVKTVQDSLAKIAPISEQAV